MLLNSLQFSSYLSWLTFLIGESWRVRYVLIQCFTILQRAASDEQDQKKCPSGLHIFLTRWPCIISPHVRTKQMWKGGRPLQGTWKMPGLAKQARTIPPPLSHPFSPLSRLLPKASAQLYSTPGHISWRTQHPSDIRNHWWFEPGVEHACFSLEGFCAKFEKVSQL